MIIDLLGIIVGMIGCFLAPYLYFRGRHEKDLMYASNSILVVDRQLPEEVTVNFKGDQVANLFVSRVSLWNHGNEPIRKEDISSTDPLIASSRGRILAIQGVETSRDAIGSQVNQLAENRVSIEFDF
ncbi:MAG TPA: hypothetical protein ENN47_01480 [Mesotoga infera]|uniref:Uncharacterized protein n=1 Tax=Mesotoga infera TaxID=1236046 RepID=A0A7C1GRT6_9BACT|nr:hypothetical protein [Mesotoga infera]